MSQSPFRIKQTAIQIETDGLQRSFQFDSVIPIYTTQQQVYILTAQPIVNDWMNGINGSIIVYGQTSSGKTYTCGLGKGFSDGIVSRTLTDLFSSPKIRQFQIYLQFIQIYNDKIQSLLNPEQSDIQLKEVSKNNWQLSNSTAYKIKSCNEAIQLIKIGMENRKISATFMNQQSSRAHTVLQLTLKQPSLAQNGKMISSTLYIIDLAGSERVNKSKSTGQTFNEAVAINSSLSYLGKVITAIGHKESFIPYRHCSLTKFLSSALTINSKTCVICTLCPSLEQRYESLSTLEFAKSCREVVQTVKFEEDAAKLGQSGGCIKRSEKDYLMHLCQEAGIGIKDMYTRNEVEHLIQYESQKIDQNLETQKSERDVVLQLKEDIEVMYRQQQFKRSEEAEQQTFKLVYDKQSERSSIERSSSYRTDTQNQLEKLLNNIRKISEKTQQIINFVQNCQQKGIQTENKISMNSSLEFLNLKNTEIERIQKAFISDIKKGLQNAQVQENAFFTSRQQLCTEIQQLVRSEFYKNFLKKSAAQQKKGRNGTIRNGQTIFTNDEPLPDMVFEQKYKKVQKRSESSRSVQNKAKNVDFQYVLDKLATDLPILIQNLQKQAIYERIFYFLLIQQSCNVWNESQIFEGLIKETEEVENDKIADQMNLDWDQQN